MDIIAATRNVGKLKEIKEYFKGTKFNILSLDDVNIDTEVVEDGGSFEANAGKKASEISRVSGKMVLADDSGLMIDALNGEPGVDSAYYLGEHTPYYIRCAKILEMMTDIAYDKRSASFVCVMAIARPNKDNIYVKGVLDGKIAAEAQGSNGFGYDPIFVPAGYDVTMAGLNVSQKNKISHRGKALKLVIEQLEKLQ